MVYSNKKENKEEQTMSVINITKENFEEEVLRSEKPVLLDFYADWCGPCRMVAPVVHEIAEENDQIKVGKINVDEQMDLAMRFQVTSIPLLVVMQDGEVVNQALGARPKEAILKMIP
ncbi:MAG: thioredoxin [Oscillospiraceae bacterium]|nr:thioredoxin [Oscillospiraceae bacterium]